MASVNYVLYEAPMGYGVFQVEHQADSIGLRSKETQEAINDLSRFGKMIKLLNFTPFHTGKEALSEINMISEGVMSDNLKSILELNLPKTSGKKSKVVLAVAEKNLASSIKSSFTGVDCETGETSEVAADFLRGVRLHADKLLKGLQTGETAQAGLGLGHAYSRSKVKFNTTKNDNHIIQASATIDFQDKGVNQFFMRVREWYGWHFPELIKIVSDNLTYARLVIAIGDKSTLTNDRLHDIAALVEEDGEKAQAIIDAAKVSMGLQITAQDLEIVKGFAQAVVQQAEARRSTSSYLEKKMGVVAPNLQCLIGTPVAARLISHAGSLTSLSKYLANKCSIASRIDNFSEEPSVKFGQVLRQQVEDRLEFYASGKKPAKNADVMASALDIVEGDDMQLDESMMAAPVAGEVEKDKKKSKKEKKDKSDKKEKKRKRESEVGAAEPAPVEDGEKKKKKKKSKHDD
ncbi:hypothetical protein BN1708_011899, partial [Verticillium longisporum]